MTVLLFLIVLGSLIIVHELGHFFAARLARVQVLEFGVGMPPRAFGFTRGGTTYSLNFLPFGGFVRMLGEEDPSAPASFAGKSAWQRLFILGAGSAMNAVLPIVLLTVVFMTPQPVPVTDVTVLSVAPGSPAEQAGVEAGDLIRDADGRRIDNSSDLLMAINLRLGADTAWTVERRGRLVALRIPDVRVDPPEGQGAVGIFLTDARLTVASVASGSMAAQSGLLPNDLLLSVGERRVLNEDSPQIALIAVVQESPAEPIEVRVLRGGAIVTLELPPDEEAFDGLAVTAYAEETRSMGPLAAFRASFVQIGEILLLFRNEVSRWIAGASSIQVAGPIGIAQMTGDVAESGISPLILWTALLSINLAIINLIPFPALDGGRIAFVLVEIARGGRRLAPEKERFVHAAGFALLIAAIVMISVNDIQRLFA
ncbi:MAG: RIP metalloprotease RseP [Chloroflexi bacterium]|nr:RIP metalloprotease RseP [Chloroflexota bacterium]MYB84103.1 RIP metalloprotease RseP [Chloroflexota bacterium]